jgi:hypothetical protein
MVSAPTWRSQNTPNSSTGAVSTDLPAGFQANDILILTVGAEETVGTIATPSGWTQIGSQLNSGSGTTGNDMAIFWKRATGSETTFNVADTGVWTLSSIQAISGCIQTGNPIDTFNTQAEAVADTSFTLPEITTSVDNTLILVSVVHGIGASNNFGAPGGATNVSGKTERTDYGADIGGLGEGGGTACWTGTLATAGVTGGSFTATSGASTRKTGFILALIPQPDPEDTDTGSGTEGAESIAGTAVDTDTGTGSETEFVGIPIADSDTGAGAEGTEGLVQTTEYLIFDNFDRQDEDPLGTSTSGHDWTSG